MLTALGQESVVLEAIKSGARDFVLKPFEPGRVLNAIRKALAIAGRSLCGFVSTGRCAWPAAERYKEPAGQALFILAPAEAGWPAARSRKPFI